MAKVVVVKINSRKHDFAAYEERIVFAMRSIGLEFDGTETDFEDELNRSLFFMTTKDIDVEVVDIGDDDDEEEEDEDDSD